MFANFALLIYNHYIMETNIKTKVCTKCGRELPITEFHINRRTKDGLQHYCKACRCEYMRQYAQTHTLKTNIPPYSQNPDLADKQPREIIAQVKTLINELRARGYSYEGKLTYLQTINL